MQAPQDKFAEVNGVRLHYLIAGKGDRRRGRPRQGIGPLADGRAPDQVIPKLVEFLNR
jgi:hypothetical protein